MKKIMINNDKILSCKLMKSFTSVVLEHLKYIVQAPPELVVDLVASL